MNKISNNYEQFCLLYPSVNWLVDHTINFDGKTPEFKISKHFSLIGYDDNTAFVAYVKPQFNSLNYNITIMDAIFDTFIVKHVNKQTQYYGCSMIPFLRTCSGAEQRIILDPPQLNVLFFSNSRYS